MDCDVSVSDMYDMDTGKQLRGPGKQLRHAVSAGGEPQSTHAGLVQAGCSGQILGPRAPKRSISSRTKSPPHQPHCRSSDMPHHMPFWCVRWCVRACVRARVRACVRAIFCAWHPCAAAVHRTTLIFSVVQWNGWSPKGIPKRRVVWGLMANDVIRYRSDMTTCKCRRG